MVKKCLYIEQKYRYIRMLDKTLTLNPARESAKTSAEKLEGD